MFRSVSSSRVSDDTYYSIYSHSPTSKAVSPALRALALEANEFPDESSPFSTPSKKDKLARIRSEKAVHLIPLVLLLCALVLWIFSNPDIHMPIKNEVIDAKVKGKTGERYVDSSATSQLKDSLEGMSNLGLSKHKEAHKLATNVRSSL